MDKEIQQIEIEKVREEKRKLINAEEIKLIKSGLNQLELEIKEHKKLTGAIDRVKKDQWIKLKTKEVNFWEKINPNLRALTSKENQLLKEINAIELEEEKNKLEEEEKKKEKKKEELKEKPINIRRYLTRWKIKSQRNALVWKILYLSEKREKRILEQICKIYNLKLNDKLSEYKKRKYKKYRITEYKYKMFLVPIEKSLTQNIKKEIIT
jgi:hypothetical protein